MAIVRWGNSNREWSPVHDLVDMQRSLARLFDDPAVMGRRGDGLSILPAVDVHNDKGELVITADLPGVKQEDVDVAIEGDTLTIKAERHYEHEHKEKDAYQVERAYGTFHRALTLPTPVDREKVKASFKNGVLEVRLPKAAEAQAKKITIQS